SPDARAGVVTVLPTVPPHCSASTINRKLSAVASFYQFHARHGVDCAELLTTMKPGGSRGSWRPFLAHLSTGADQGRKTIKLTPERRLPRALEPDSISKILDSCERLRDRFLIE